MAMLSVPIPDDVLQRAREQFQNDEQIADFLGELLRDMTTAPSPLDSQTIKMLEEGRATPLLDAGEIDWESKLQRLQARRR